MFQQCVGYRGADNGIDCVNVAVREMSEELYDVMRNYI
jgi:hypothetical protein